MKVIRGGIYKVSNAWKKYNDALLDHRPVIVIQCNEEFVYGVLMGALPRNIKMLFILSARLVERDIYHCAHVIQYTRYLLDI